MVAFRSAKVRATILTFHPHFRGAKGDHLATLDSDQLTKEHDERHCNIQTSPCVTLNGDNGGTKAYQHEAQASVPSKITRSRFVRVWSPFAPRKCVHQSLFPSALSRSERRPSATLDSDRLTKEYDERYRNIQTSPSVTLNGDNDGAEAYQHEAQVLMLRVDGVASENWYCKKR
ncbi:hypothetical protein Mal33_17500 [Rosistilla oblonga]|uniref:Uncharacterized protein n=1 Tax=Rosistilla oblonga TaxID=2527990 RepID=A0A518IRR4_9BACT|nr:hypothetical protein Mal33_17500 [Rosistilla oblonga]